MSIIIAMVYVIFTLLSKQLYQYSSQTEHINNYNQLHTVLTRDLHNANTIKYEAHELVLLVKNDSLKYTYKNNTLTRSYLGSNDTFLTPVTAFNLVENKAVFNNKMKCLNVTYNLFDQDIKAVYFKDEGMSNHINKLFFSHGN